MDPAPDGPLRELQLLAAHALMREYADVDDPAAALPHRLLLLLRHFRERLTALVAEWLRVGYCQGNFNSGEENYAEILSSKTRVFRRLCLLLRVLAPFGPTETLA